MKKKDSYTIRAFIAAPADQDLGSLKEELAKRSIQAYTAYELSPVTTSLAANIERAIKDADLIIAVVTEQPSPNVFFELGMAHALRKPFLVLISPKYGNLPSDLAGTFYLRADPKNREAISFALDQCLQRIERGVSQPKKLLQEGRPLGDKAGKFLALIQEKGSQLRGRELEKLVADLLRETGVETVTESTQPEAGADIAVWSNALQPIVGNPLLIEVKSRLQNEQQLLDALLQVEQYRIKSGARLALLVVNVALSALTAFPGFGGVLVVTLTDLVERLRFKTFADAILELRNLYVHSGGK